MGFSYNMKSCFVFLTLVTKNNVTQDMQKAKDQDSKNQEMVYSYDT